MIAIVLFNFVGVLYILLGLPLLLRRVPPNPLYGVRYRATLSNEEIWYEINVLGGRWLIGVGLGLILLMGALFALGIASPVLETAGLIWLLGGTLLTCVVTYRAAQERVG